MARRAPVPSSSFFQAVNTPNTFGQSDNASWSAYHSMATHPPATTAPGGADPVKELTDGAKQLEINQAQNADAPAGQKPAKGEQPKKEKKEKKPKGASAEGGSSRPLEVRLTLSFP